MKMPSYEPRPNRDGIDSPAHFNLDLDKNRATITVDPLVKRDGRLVKIDSLKSPDANIETAHNRRGKNSEALSFGKDVFVAASHEGATAPSRASQLVAARFESDDSRSEDNGVSIREKINDAYSSADAVIGYLHESYLYAEDMKGTSLVGLSAAIRFGTGNQFALVNSGSSAMYIKSPDGGVEVVKCSDSEDDAYTFPFRYLKPYSVVVREVEEGSRIILAPDGERNETEFVTLPAELKPEEAMEGWENSGSSMLVINIGEKQVNGEKPSSKAAPKPRKEKSLKKAGKRLLTTARTAYTTAVYWPFSREQHNRAGLKGTALKVAAVMGGLAAAKYGFDVDVPFMPDSMPKALTELPGDIADGTRDVWDMTWNDLTSLGDHSENVQQTKPAEIPELTTSPLESWTGATNEKTGYLTGTMYDETAKAFNTMAEQNKVGVDVAALREQHPDTFEPAFHQLVQRTLDSNGLNWETAADAQPGATVKVESESFKTFLADQNIKLPEVTTPSGSVESNGNFLRGLGIVGGSLVVAAGLEEAVRRTLKRRRAARKSAR